MLNRAFSLLELLITLAILGILIAITYPSYQKYVLKSYRAEAVTTLLELANKQELRLLEHGRYTSELTELGMAGSMTISGRYRIVVTQATPEQFLLSATAEGPQQQDTNCLQYNINQFGQRNLDLTEPLSCWH